MRTLADGYRASPVAPVSRGDERLLLDWLRSVVGGVPWELGDVSDGFVTLVKRTRLDALAALHGARHPDLDSVLPVAFARVVTAQRTARRCVDLLARGGVSALMVKGPAFAVQALGDALWRPPIDVDLLVMRDDLRRVRRLLAAGGYREPLHYPVWYEERWHDHAVFVTPTDFAKTLLEVHWDIVRPGLSRLPVARLLDESVEVDCGETRLPAPNLTWQLVLLAGHAVQHDFEVRSLLDVALVAARLDEAGWRAAVQNARASGLGPAVRYAVRLSSALLDWEPPDELERLRTSRLRDAVVRPYLARVALAQDFRWRRLQAGKVVKPLCVAGGGRWVVGLGYSLTDRPNVCATIDSRLRSLRRWGLRRGG